MLFSEHSLHDGGKKWHTWPTRDKMKPRIQTRHGGICVNGDALPETLLEVLIEAFQIDTGRHGAIG